MLFKLDGGIDLNGTRPASTNVGIANTDPGYRDTMEKAGVTATSSTPEEFARLLARHNERWLAVIKHNNIAPE